MAIQAARRFPGLPPRQDACTGWERLALARILMEKHRFSATGCGARCNFVRAPCGTPGSEAVIQPLILSLILTAGHIVQQALDKGHLAGGVTGFQPVLFGMVVDKLA